MSSTKMTSTSWEKATKEELGNSKGTFHSLRAGGFGPSRKKRGRGKVSRESLEQGGIRAIESMENKKGNRKRALGELAKH